MSGRAAQRRGPAQRAHGASGARSHFETTSADIAEMYKHITGKDLDLSSSSGDDNEGGGGGGGGH